MAPIARVLAQALLIRLEREAVGSGVSPALLFQHAALPPYTRTMLMAAREESRDARVRLLLASLASGKVGRTRSGVAEIAREVGLTVRCLSRLTCRETGLTIQRHIQYRRLLAAAHLVSRTFLSVGEIAAIVGYQDGACLNRCFQSVLGVAPIDLRSYGLRETCRAYLGGREDAAFARWVSNRLPMLVAGHATVAAGFGLPDGTTALKALGGPASP